MRQVAIMAALAAAGIFGSAANAEDLQTPGTATLAAFPPGVEICYLKTYGTAHLKSGQKLTSFMLYRLLRPDPAKEEIEADAAEVAANDHAPVPDQWVSVLAKFNDLPGFYHQTVSCLDGDRQGSFTCGRDCDGGGFAAEEHAGGLTADFGNGYGGLALESSCDPDEEGRDRWMTPEEAGIKVQLEKWPVAECLAADQAARPGFAGDAMPLRERVAVSGWRCLKRVYDKAHLKKHPKQNVTAMAIAIKGPARVEADQDGWRSTLLDVTLSLRLRSGERASKAVTCTADEFQYRCGEEFRLRRRDGATAMLLAGSYGGEAGEPDAMPKLNDLTLGADDLIFKLQASDAADCGVE